MPLNLPPEFWNQLAQASSVPLLVPSVPKSSRAEWITTSGRLVSSINVRTVEQNRFIVKPINLADSVDWCRDFESLLCSYDVRAAAFRAHCVATEEHCKAYRVATFIQGEEVPLCCGKPMYFVGQIDDNNICTEPPLEHKHWWHDVASFYVFTCSTCLECKAVGQQF